MKTLADRRMDFGVSGLVDRGCGFVHDDDLGVLEECAGESGELALALGKFTAVAFHLFVQVAESVVVVTGDGAVGGGG